MIGSAPPKLSDTVTYLEMTAKPMRPPTPIPAAKLALMRADSERRYFFREMAIQHADQLRPTSVLVRLFNCEFPAREAYFIELWYDDEWLIDQRLDIV